MGRVLVACESSGIVREAFRRLGHDAWSCDLLPADDGSPYHIQGDVVNELTKGWDLMIAHPPCTYLCSSGLHWNKKDASRQVKTDNALAFAWALWHAPIHRICLENPVGKLGTVLCPATQYIQPHEFGHDASKRTGLWLRNLHPLYATAHVKPRHVMHAGKMRNRWANQTDSGQNRLGPSPNRWKLRSQTYPGIAEAMATQWGPLLP